MVHQMISRICSDLLRAALEPQVSDSFKSFSNFDPRAFDKYIGPIVELGFIRATLSNKTCGHQEKIGICSPNLVRSVHNSYGVHGATLTDLNADFR